MAVQIIQPKHFPYVDYKRYSFSLGTEGRGFVFTSGQSASEFDDSTKKIVCRGNLQQQARVAHEKLKLILQAASSDFSDVVKVVDYVSPAVMDLEPLIDVRREYFDDRLPSHSEVHVGNLLRSDALVETELVAIKGKNRNLEYGSSTPWDTYARLIQKNGLIFISSQLSVDLDSGRFLGEGDVEVQLAKIYKNVRELLAEFGAKMEDIVKVSQYVKEGFLAKTVAMRASGKDDLLRGNPPTSIVEVRKLGHPEALVEVEVVADVSGGKRLIPSAEPSEIGAVTITGQGLVFLPVVPPKARQLVDAKHSLNIKDSMREIFEHVGVCLSSSSLTPGDIAKTTDYLTPDTVPQYRETAQVRRDFFRNQLPASSGVIVNHILPENAPLSMDSLAIES